MIANKIQ